MNGKTKSSISKIIIVALLISLVFAACSKKASIGQQALDVAYAYQKGEIDSENATIQLMQLQHQTEDKQLAAAISDIYLNITGEGYFENASKKLEKAIKNLEAMEGKGTSPDSTGCNGIDVTFVDLRSTGYVNQEYETDLFTYSVLSYDLGFPDHYNGNGSGYMCLKVHVKNNSNETLRPLEDRELLTYYGDGNRMGLTYMDFYGNGLTMSQDYHIELLGGAEGDAYLVYSFQENSIPQHIIGQSNGKTVIEFDID